MSLPSPLPAIEKATEALGFDMASDRETGGLLRTLAASKPGGRFLELGTGTGLSTAWLLDGMTSETRLLSVDNDEAVVAVAKKYLGEDAHVSFTVTDGSDFIHQLQPNSFDLIFADTWPGKYWDLDLALNLLKTGGIYLVDDMNAQPNWPEGHAEKATALTNTLLSRQGFHVTKLEWSTGLILCVKR